MSEPMHTVKRAVIMAAGIGKRMQPLTFETPKPLIRVNGTRMIDTVVRALHENGIREIYVVVGYLKEQFYEWAKNQPGIQLIENPYYDVCNNISSLYAARQHLQDCIILDGDQIIYHPQILDPHFVRSGYNAVWCGGKTKEWLLQTENGIIKSCSRTGGSNGWQLYSVSRWTAEDGEKLSRFTAQEFEGGNRQIYWDDIPMFCYFEAFELGIREMKADDIVEIDSLEELAGTDPGYRYILNTQESERKQS